MTQYQQCTRCIMDNRSDKTITFNEQGECNYCTNALLRKDNVYFPNEYGEKFLTNLVKKIKDEGKGKKYDCMIGVSGGLDSSYLVYWAAKQHLRMLCVHVDDGYDTQIAKDNIHKLCTKTGAELVTLTVDAEQFNDLTRAYLLAGVPNLAVPQDNALFAALYRYARKQKIRTLLTGSNFALECILQKGNTADAFDKTNLLDIHRKFGTKPISNLPIMSQYERFISSRWFSKHCVLNYMDYNKAKALQELKEFCDYNYYTRKHHESILTRFIQEYYFYHKFGVDKRTSHLSSLIISGQMTRDEALKLMEEPLLDEKALSSDIEMILKNLQITREEFDQIMREPPKQHTDYRISNYKTIRAYLLKIKQFVLARGHQKVIISR